MGFEVIIPPSVKPVSPAQFGQADDQTVPFIPRFARGRTQRQLYGDPQWRLKVRYEGLASADRALLKSALNNVRGGAGTIRMTPGLPLRGSFPATELLTNNDFSNGTTGWTTNSAYSLSVQDRIMRCTRLVPPATEIDLLQGVSPTAYAPLVQRHFVSALSANIGSVPGYAYDSVMSATTGASSLVGMRTLAFTPLSGTLNSYLYNNGGMAGDYFEASFTSLSRCALVDNGLNVLLQSQTFQTTWTQTDVTVSADSTTAPDGTSTADSVLETATTAAHFLIQSVTVSSSAADYTCSVVMKSISRQWAHLRMREDTGSTQVYQTFDLTNGVVGSTTATGANWSNLRSAITSMGNGWYRCTITARKTNAATSISPFFGPSDSDSVNSYLGDITKGVYAWGASLAQSSVPVRYVATTTTAATGTSQTGRSLYVKGLPASTNGLLLAGDLFEINGELKEISAPLNSNAAGLGLLQFGPSLARSPSDNDPVIINNPMGTFMLAGDPQRTERFGVYTDFDLELVEVYS